jgi:hypothetical protein
LSAEHRATAPTTSVFADSFDIEGAPAVGDAIEASWQVLEDGLEYGVNDAPKTLR